MYKNLKSLRQSLNMTQKEFAASLGIGYTTYNGYETGAREPKSDFWVAVAKKYGVTIDYLMGFSDNPHQTSTDISHEKGQSQNEDEIAGFIGVLAQQIEELTEADKLLLLTIAKHLSETRGKSGAFRSESGGYFYLYGNDDTSSVTGHTEPPQKDK